jgi:hypothetical protein
LVPHFIPQKVGLTSLARGMLDLDLDLDLDKDRPRQVDNLFAGECNVSCSCKGGRADWIALW